MIDKLGAAFDFGAEALRLRAERQKSTGIEYR